MQWSRSAIKAFVTMVSLSSLQMVFDAVRRGVLEDKSSNTHGSDARRCGVIYGLPGHCMEFDLGVMTGGGRERGVMAGYDDMEHPAARNLPSDNCAAQNSLQPKTA
jgi:hypothetical protein